MHAGVPREPATDEKTNEHDNDARSFYFYLFIFNSRCFFSFFFLSLQHSCRGKMRLQAMVRPVARSPEDAVSCVRCYAASAAAEAEAPRARRPARCKAMVVDRHHPVRDHRDSFCRPLDTRICTKNAWLSISTRHSSTARSNL